MDHELKDAAEAILRDSSFLASVRAIKSRPGPSRVFGDGVRRLSEGEVRELESRGNRCPDWGRLCVAPGFITLNIHDSEFYGDCVIGVLDGSPVEAEPGVELPSGISRSTIISSEIGSRCLVANAGMVSRQIIDQGAVVRNVGSLTAGDGAAFGNGVEISAGIETGGREVLSFAELTMPLATAVAMERYNREFLDFYAGFVRRYLDACRLPFGVIGRGAVVRNTSRVHDCFLGDHALVDGALLLENCTVLSSKDEPSEVCNGAVVRNTCLQWGSSITSLAIVESSLLMEHSHVERHGKVTHSIIGPNSGIAEGEVTSCLVGPFVGFHHQSLLIAALWPEGRGNVGYGANVGSNHTGKAPDQEIICGEGLFFGLGVNIKFPSDFSDAPYTIIATGVDALPQRVEYPFSLINKASISYPGVSSAHNEILPGWVLSGSIFSVRRNEAKFRRRNLARRSVFDFETFRPEIIDRMVIARNRLLGIREQKAVYLQRDIQGLGKNYLLERNRKAGIDAYNYYIEFFALRGLERRIASLLEEEGPGGLADLYERETEDVDWEYIRKLIGDQGYSRRTLAENLTRLAEMHERIAQSTQLSKEKDDGRGAHIIPDYQYAHRPAREDPFIVASWEEARGNIARIWDLVKRLP
jgi:NDP-sugar pyrophosphorylase family protein